MKERCSLGAEETEKMEGNEHESESSVGGRLSEGENAEIDFPRRQWENRIGRLRGMFYSSNTLISKVSFLIISNRQFPFNLAKIIIPSSSSPYLK